MTYMPSSQFGYEPQPNYSRNTNGVQLPFLTSCEHTERRLNKLMIVRQFEAGDAIQMRGRGQHRVHVILLGTAALSTSLPDGRTQILRLLLPTDFIGRLGSGIVQYDATALSSVTTCSFSRPEFEALMRLSPEMTRRLLHKTLAELDEARDWLLVLGRKTALEKVASFLLFLDKRCLRNAQNTLFLPLCQFEMADLLGLTHETVSRQMALLRDQGVIHCQGQRRVEIRDLARLAELSGNDPDQTESPYALQ